MKTHISFEVTDLIRNLKIERGHYNLKKKDKGVEIIKVYRNKKGRPFSIFLPKKINISPEVVGLIVGEGYIGDRRFVFANSNEKAIQIVKLFLKQFNLPLDFYLEVSIKNQDNHFVHESKTFWENLLEVSIKRVRLRKEFNNITSHGTIHIGINNSLVTKLLEIIIKESKKKIEENFSLSKYYLKGVLAAEGNINVKKSTKCVYMVRISASKEEEREHYKRCLEKIGIKIYCKDMPTVSKQEANEKGWKTNHGRAGAVIISRWENFIRILELGLLDLSEDKKQKFLKYFLNNKFTRQFLEFKSFLGKKFSMKEAQTHFNFSGRCLNRVLTLNKQGYISKEKITKSKVIYLLTGRYSKIYDILNSGPNTPTF